jgi:hypothetical protein
MPQFSVAVNNARLDVIETTIGASAQLKFRTGAPPANCAAADTGTVIATVLLPADYLANASAQSKVLQGVWQDLSADAGGVIGHFRIYETTGVTCHWQGTAGQAVPLTTSALTAANNNVLTFASTTGVTTQMFASGTGVVPGSRVIAVTGTTVTLNYASIAGVASAAAITFAPEVTVDNATVVATQQINVTSFTLNEANV